MVPTGRFPMQADNASPPSRGWCWGQFHAVTECSSRDETRHCPGSLRATRHAQGSGPAGGSDHLRRIDRQPRAGGPGRAAKLWGLSDQTAAGPHREEPPHGRGGSRRASEFRQLQAWQGNGRSGAATRQTPSRPVHAPPQAACGPVWPCSPQHGQRAGVFLRADAFFLRFLHRDQGCHRLQTLSNQSRGAVSPMNIYHPCVLGTRRKTG